MTDFAYKALKSFEDNADHQVKCLKVGKLPTRAMWASFHLTIFNSLHISGRSDARVWKTGDTTCHRLSYLLPWFLGLVNSLSPIEAVKSAQLVKDEDPDDQEFNSLLLYAHFCEVMPDVHRGRLVVKKITGGFSLQHASPDIARAEATDIIISELAIPHLARREPRLPDKRMLDLANSASVNWDEIIQVARERMAGYHEDIREDPVVTDKVMNEVFGFDRIRFREIQAAVLALGSVCLELGLILWIQSVKQNLVPHKAAEFISICLPETELIDKLTNLSQNPRQNVCNFLEAFIFDQASSKNFRGGEGFTPPFVRIELSIVFSPDFIQRFLHPRNAIHHLIKSDKKKFDVVISRDLEPTLVQLITDEFVGINGLEIVCSVKFKGGELDILIVDSVTGDVVVAEVKAPLPPQGSRATERLADRMREGLDQLRGFQSLSQQQRLVIVNSRVKHKLSSAKFHYMIVGRACFGAPEVWMPNSPATPATLPLIRLAAASLRNSALSVAGELTNQVSFLTRKILKEVKWNWSSGKMTLFGQTVITPQCLFDGDVVTDWRTRASD